MAFLRSLSDFCSYCYGPA